MFVPPNFSWFRWDRKGPKREKKNAYSKLGEVGWGQEAKSIMVFFAWSKTPEERGIIVAFPLFS